MRFSASVNGFGIKALAVWRRHHAAIVILLVLSVIAGASNYFLRGALLNNGMNSNPDAANVTTDDTRACTSIGTPFQDMTQLSEVMDFFRTKTSEVVTERENYFPHRRSGSVYRVPAARASRRCRSSSSSPRSCRDGDSAIRCPSAEASRNFTYRSR